MHADACAAKLTSYGGPGNAQLGLDLAQGPILAVRVDRTLNVNGATVAAACFCTRNQSATTIRVGRNPWSSCG